MIIYNVTVSVEKEVEQDWVQWMKETHIPDIINTGHFNDHRFLRLLNETEHEGETYAIQYFAETLDDLETYMTKHAPSLGEEHSKRYGTKCVAFRTFLETV